MYFPQTKNKQTVDLIEVKMPGKILTVGDLLNEINGLEADTPVRSSNGNPLFVGIKVYKSIEGSKTIFMIEGELKPIVTNKSKYNLTGPKR